MRANVWALEKGLVEGWDGKVTWEWMMRAEPLIFRLTSAMARDRNTAWMTGYVGQRIMVVEDLNAGVNEDSKGENRRLQGRTWLDEAFINAICDRTGVFQIKGAAITPAWERVYFTSNLAPEDALPNFVKFGVCRRIKRIVFMSTSMLPPDAPGHVQSVNFDDLSDSEKNDI